MSKKPKIRAKPPYLRSISIKSTWTDFESYPYSLPLLRDGDFSLRFDHPITIIVGENGIGKSTLLEGIAVLAGFDDAGGGSGYRPVDHSMAIETPGGILSKCLIGGWLPKISAGWFFKAETFFSVARYLDQAARESNEMGPDFLSYSHGEGFLRFFHERCRRRGIFILDEPESALSPRRQIELMRILREAEHAGEAQFIIATHSPLIMAYPGARLLRMTKDGLAETDFRETDHFALMKEFTSDPETFVAEMFPPSEGDEQMDLYSQDPHPY
ncbi:AAA family ATPase [Rhizobium sp.]|uniref:AAA family ATPase n=1 Tax=Rhizobium sp. TaxID=391 RepID=UPI0028AEB291